VNVGFLTPVVYPFVKGGVEKRIHEVGSRIANRGHEVTIYSRHWWDGPRQRKYEGMTLHAIAPSRELYPNGDRRSTSGSLELAARSFSPLLRSNHDLVVTPVAPYFHVFSSKFATLFQSTPLVVTWHEVWTEYWKQYMGPAGSIGIIVEKAAAKIPQHSVTPSEMTAENLSALCPSRADIEVIPNGIDFEDIQATTSAKNGFDVVYVGRLIQDKNVNWLLDSFDSVATSYDITLGIIGDGPCLKNLQEHAHGLESSDRISFLGFLDEYDDVIAHMKAADIFVSPSTREGFGITLLEAMASNCLVITVEHPNSAGSEVVGDAGFVTEPSTESIADTLEKVLAGKQPNRNPIEVAKQYDWEFITDATIEYYSTLI